MKKEYVLDACALIAFINGEHGADKVEALLREALSGDTEIFMNKLNLYEVYYGICRTEGQDKADQVYDMIRRLPLHIVDVLEDDVLRRAAAFKAKYRMSVADSIALGEASSRNAALMTPDHHEFDSVERQEQTKIFWMR